jgi:hypothetical protein
MQNLKETLNIPQQMQSMIHLSKIIYFQHSFLFYSNTYLGWLVYGDPSSQPPLSADTHTEPDNPNLGGFLRRHAYAVVSGIE